MSTEHPLHHLIISAKDGGGLVTNARAHVYISVISSKQQPPIFKQARYTFFVQEDAAPQSVVGTVIASSRDPSKFAHDINSIYFFCVHRLISITSCLAVFNKVISGNDEEPQRYSVKTEFL